MSTWDDSEVHRTHCCTKSCKYLESDCPVATGKILPAYQCEDCTCAEMNPAAFFQMEAWWQSLSDNQKVEVYLREKQVYNYI